LQRSKETLENASSRLTTLETGLQQADSILRSLKTEIQALARAFTEKVAQFQNETTTSFSATAAQLNQELKTERTIRMQTVSQIDQQIREVYRNTTDAMNKMTSFLAGTKQQYQQALTSLSKSAKEGLIACNSSVTDGFNQLSDRMDLFVRDSNAQFESLEADITSTVQALSQHILKSREGLETAITNLSQARINGETEIVARYDQLKATLSQQLRHQAEHMENACQASIQAVMEHCERTIAQIKEELARVKEQIGRIGRLETRLTQLTSSVEQTRAQILSEVARLDDRYRKLNEDLQRVEDEFRDRAQKIEAKLEQLEDPQNQPKFATREELEEAVGRTRQTFESTLSAIEQQIGQLSSNITGIRMSGGRMRANPGVLPELDRLRDQAIREMNRLNK
jgi:DNA repair exonuclease SbcCD ATPase subunit